MTESEKLAMTVRLAEGAMGWRVHIRNTSHWTDAAKWDRCDYVVRAIVDEWRPFDSIINAWMLVDALEARGWLLSLGRDRDLNEAGDWVAAFGRIGTIVHGKVATGDTAPGAICRAALAVLDSEARP